MSFFNSWEVSITCGTSAATIEYALTAIGDPEPTTGWIAYTAPFTLTSSQRVYARATASGLDDSFTAFADFQQLT